MNEDLTEQLGRALAHNRTTGTLTELPLDGIQSLEEAQDIQVAALEAYSNDLDGFALVGTSNATRRTLGFSDPIYSEIPNKAHKPDGCRLRLPHGVLGAQCEFLFTMGQPFPRHRQAITRESASGAIVACQPAIGILGRRTLHGPFGSLASTADFGLHVATIAGSVAKPADLEELEAIQVAASINGKLVASASAIEILGHPVEAVMWLARELSAQGRVLNPGDIVATGSCTPILQVLPGQELSVDFASFGQVSCSFD